MSATLEDMKAEAQARIDEAKSRRDALRARIPEAERIAARIPVLTKELEHFTRAAGEDPSLLPRLRELRAEQAATLAALRDGFTVDQIRTALTRTAPEALQIRQTALKAVITELRGSIKERARGIAELRSMVASGVDYGPEAAEFAGRLARAEAARDLLVEFAAKLDHEARIVWNQMQES